jgi:hypothetical protein
VDIRHSNQIPILYKFADQTAPGRFKFNDKIALEVYLDFKRENRETILKLVNTIDQCRCIRDLTVAGSPNPFFTDRLFEIFATNHTIERFDINMEYLPQTSYGIMQEVLARNQGLKHLFLRNMSMNTSDMEHIIKGLALNPMKNLISLGIHDV